MRSTSSAVSRAAAGVYAALAAQVVSVAALAVFEESRGARLASQIAAFGGDPASPAARTVSGAATTFAVLVLALLAATVITAVAFLSWLRQVRPGTPPVALAAACLVPGVNLVVPPFLADLAWREAPVPPRGGRAGLARQTSGARGTERGGTGNGGTGPGERTRWLVLLACWWMSWLAVLGLVFAGQGRDGLTGLGVSQAAATAVAALLFASAVREVTARHTGAGLGRTARPPARSQARSQALSQVLSQDRPQDLPRVRVGQALDEARNPALDQARDQALGQAERPSGRPVAYTAPADGGGEDHRSGDGPELPELACQSRRWGSPDRPGNRSPRAAGGAPLSE